MLIVSILIDVIENSKNSFVTLNENSQLLWIKFIIMEATVVFIAINKAKKNSIKLSIKIKLSTKLWFLRVVWYLKFFIILYGSNILFMKVRNIFFYAALNVRQKACYTFCETYHSLLTKFFELFHL